MSGHVRSEVPNEHCKTPVEITVLGGKDIECNMIKIEVKEEPRLSQSQCTEEIEMDSFTCLDLKCDESQYKVVKKEAVLEDNLDIESQGLGNEKVKYEVLVEALGIKEHELIYKGDGQHEESEDTEYLKLKPEGGFSTEKCKQLELENIEDKFTLAPVGKEDQGKPRPHSVSEESSSKIISTDMLGSTEKTQVNSQVTRNTSMYTAIDKDNVSVNSDNNCTDTNIDVDIRNSTTSRMSHRQKTRHECEICQLDFNRTGDLRRHIRTHSGERPFECEICQQQFNRAEHLKRHLKTHTDERPFECKICKVKFKYKLHLKLHLRIHTGEKSFECEICQRTFNYPSALKRHLRIHTGERPHKCEICEVRFKDTNSLKKHMRIHTGEKPFKCEICQRQFRLTEHLKTHLRTHTRERPFECQICKAKFRHKPSLKTHFSTHTGEKSFECDICQRQFYRGIHLKTHMRTHTGEKPFECEICRVRFNEKGNLKTHMRIHTGEKPFECEICRRKFNRAEHLKTHLRTHTGEKPFEGEICNVEVS